MLSLLEKLLRSGYRELTEEEEAFEQRTIEADRELAELDIRLHRAKRKAGLEGNGGNGESC